MEFLISLGKTVITALESRPVIVSFFAGIFGSLVGLAGVIITLRHSQKTHASNLQEERNKIRDEREFKALQDAHINAAEAILRFIQYLVTLPDRNLPVGGIVAEEITNMGVAVSKLHFYSNLKTIEKASELAQILNESFGLAMPSKLTAMLLGVDIQILVDQIKNIENRNISLQEEINILSKTNPQNPLIITFRNQLSSNYKEISDICSKQGELIAKQHQATEACRDIVLKSLQKIHEPSRDLQILMRRELQFDLDETAYIQLMNTLTKQTGKTLESNIENIRTTLSKKMD